MPYKLLQRLAGSESGLPRWLQDGLSPRAFAVRALTSHFQCYFHTNAPYIAWLGSSFGHSVLDDLEFAQ